MSSTLNTIPASLYVGVTPSVLGTGGTGIDLIEVMLTKNTRVPIGALLAFPDKEAVEEYFGATSMEALEANVYFEGPELAIITPNSLLFAQYPIAPVDAYLRGGSVSSLSLTALQAISGTLTISIDGTPHTSSSINLSGATSFAGAAQLIDVGLGLAGPTIATFTGEFGASGTGTSTGTSISITVGSGIIHPGSEASAALSGTGVPSNTFIISQTSGSAGSTGVYLTNNATTASGGSITVTSDIVDASSVTGIIAVGQQVAGSSIAAGTFITGLGTGTGGAGSYITTQSQNLASEAMTTEIPVVTYDTISGGFVIISSTTGASSTIDYGSGSIAAPLNLTQVTGAILSQGAIAAAPGSFMSALTAQSTDWATFQTLFDPDAGSGNAQKQLFAAWANEQNDQYAYLAWDTDITPTESTAATSSLGYILKQSASSGTVPIYEIAGMNSYLAAFIGGYAASLDFNATNGRATAAFKSQAGIIPSVTSALAASNLVANGYNYYGAVATAGANWNFFYPGSISGAYSWLDSFLNQIWFNNQLTIALMNYLTTVKRIPYNPVGYAAIRQVLSAGANQANIALPPPSPIAAALNNGVITAGTPLSSSQAQVVNAQAGMAIDQILSVQGWYLLIQPANAATRGARLSPTIIIFYTDGGSIQQINLSSILVQ